MFVRSQGTLFWESWENVGQKYFEGGGLRLVLILRNVFMAAPGESPLDNWCKDIYSREPAQSSEYSRYRDIPRIHNSIPQIHYSQNILLRTHGVHHTHHNNDPH